MTKKTEVTLVRNGSTLYPHKDEDFDKLSNIGSPMNRIDDSYMPVLRRFAPTLKFKIVEVFDLETAMIARFGKLWPHEVELSAKVIQLTFPRQASDELVETATAALRRWYRGHFIRLEQVTKRGGKTVRITLTKKLIVNN